MACSGPPAGSWRAAKGACICETRLLHKCRGMRKMLPDRIIIVTIIQYLENGFMNLVWNGPQISPIFHNLLHSYEILVKFCTEHDSINARHLLIATMILSLKIGVMDERDSKGIWD